MQLHKDFGFAAAAARVPYLHDLGISHVYSSPIFTAKPGSMHGYDVIDPLTVNPELGGKAGLESLCQILREHGMGLIVDFVPNHMAVGGPHNAWWLDVLRWGRDSPYAGFFDIDWEPADARLHHKLLAPFLGKPYGEALEAGELRLGIDEVSGELRVNYFDHPFPLAPQDYAHALRDADPTLEPHAARFAQAVQARTRPARREQFAEALAGFQAACRAQSPAGLLQHFDPASPDGQKRLHALLERQHYRLAWWRCASDEINWRRFFDVIELAGMRVQDAAVFGSIHAGLFELVDQGLIDGVRVDHVDGLALPGPYCRQLRRKLQQQSRKAGSPRTPLLYVEKILATGEQMPADWRTDGTTGYDFMNDVAAALHDAAGAAPLQGLWTELTGRSTDFEAEERTARRRIPSELLRSDFNACALALHRLARANLKTRDITLEMIRRILAEVLVHFPVYRTYIGATGRSEADDRTIRETLERAGTTCRPGDRVALPHFDEWLGGVPASASRSPVLRRLQLRALDRFQQLTSPVAAKSVEDTAFYRHGALLSRNEVGASPAVFSLNTDEFHAAMRKRLDRFPLALLATATHDHKRGEDLRMRLATLSELPAQWRSCVLQWRGLNAGYTAMLTEGLAPDAADEYMLYQMLVGAWPMTAQFPDDTALEELGRRLAEWQTKAIREAKRQSGWLEPNAAYEEAANSFLRGILDPVRSRAFLEDVHRFVAILGPAGAVKGLAQLALKLGAPGVPDTYQGCDYWDLSLVDPDNRRPVDYAVREASLCDFGADGQLMASWRDGRVKQHLLQTMLRLRRCFPELLLKGSYEPLRFEGPLAESFIGYWRVLGRSCVAIIAPRSAYALDADQVSLRLQAPALEDTRLLLPGALARRHWLNLLAPQKLIDPSSSVPLGRLLVGWPVAALIDSRMFEPCFNP